MVPSPPTGKRFDSTRRTTCAPIGLADVLKDKKDFEGAIAAYKIANRLNPNSTYIPMQMRSCYEAKGDRDGAVTAAQEAARLYPTAFAVHHYLGDALIILQARCGGSDRGLSQGH